MMSEHATRTYEQGEGSRLVSSGTNDNVPLHHMGQWMAHWIQACKACSSKGCEKHHKTTLFGSIVDQFNGHESLAVEQVKSKQLKPLCLNINERHTSGCKDHSSSSVGNVNLISVLQSGETVEGDWEKFRITDKSTTRTNVELLDHKITCSDSRKLTESRLTRATSYRFQNLDDYGSKNEYFPMFVIDRKTETITASREKSYHDPVFVKSPINFNLEDLAPGSCIIGNTEKATRCYECLWPDNMDSVGRTSSPATHECRCQKKRNVAACMFSCGPAHKVSANTELSYMQHTLCSCSSSNRSISQVTNNNIDPMFKSSGMSWTSLKDGSTHALRDSCSNHFPYYFSTEEHGKTLDDDSTNRLLLGQKRHIQPLCSKMHLWPSKVPKLSMLDVSQHGSCRNLKSAGNGEVHKFSSTTKSFLLVADDMGLKQCQKELMTEKTAFTQVKEIAFSEMSIMETNQYYGEEETTTAPFEKSSSIGNRRCDGGIVSHLTGANNDSFSESDTQHHNPFHGSSSKIGETFSRPPKSVASASQTQEDTCRSEENGISDRVEPCSSTEKAASASNREAADHISSHIEVAEFSGSSKTSQSETCNRWVKRLQHRSLSPNRFQLCDGYSSKVQNIYRDNHGPVESVTFLPFKGKKFASIRAMALMGRAINNYKPCKFQRKEASLIWTI